MTLKRRDDDDWRIRPFQEIARLEDQMSNLFRDVFGRQELAPNDRVFAPLVDLKETDEQYIMKADLPGFDKDDITIELTSENIELSASKHQAREEEKEEEGARYLRRERCAYKFNRKIAFPSPVDTDDVNTSYENGTLTIELPKKPGTGKKTIKIE